MKKIRVKLIYIVFVILLANAGFCLSYADDRGDSHEEFLNNHFVKEGTDGTEYIVKNGLQLKKGNLVESFDVRSDGLMAIAFSNQLIGIFDNNMQLIVSFQIQDLDVDYVMWVKDELFVYGVKSSPDILINIEDNTCTAYDMRDKHDKYDYEHFFTTYQRYTDDYRYYLSLSKTRVIASREEGAYYPYILRINSKDELEVVYDAGKRYMLWKLVKILAVIIALGIVILVFRTFFQINLREETEPNYNQMPTRYTINETKKEYFDLQAFMRGKEASDEGMYRYNPLWILTTEGGDSDMSGRWVGDTITGSDIRPSADYTDISDRL